jgi:hypothetical protein
MHLALVQPTNEIKKGFNQAHVNTSIEITYGEVIVVSMPLKQQGLHFSPRASSTTPWIHSRFHGSFSQVKAVQTWTFKLQAKMSKTPRAISLPEHALPTTNLPDKAFMFCDRRACSSLLSRSKQN